MINVATLIGNLGSDPELRHTQSGQAVATFNMATTDRFKGEDGNTQEQTEWHKIVAWGKLGEICAEYLRKGSKVYICGKIQTRKWQDKDGNDRYTTEIIAREMKMLSAKRDGGAEHQQHGGYDDIHTPPMGGTGDDVPF